MSNRWGFVVYKGECMYSFESRIRYSEVDLEGKLTWVKLLDYFQDSSVFQSESLHVGVDLLAKRKRAWVLNAWQICLNRMPRLYEQVRIVTRPYEIKGFFGSRNFILESLDGECLAYANSIWTFIDTERNLPTKVTPEFDVYEFDERIEMNYCARKLQVPEEMTECETIPVTRHLIDTNGHVNNGRYVELAMELLPEDCNVMEVRAEYKKQAREGDTFFPKIAREEDKYTVVMADAKGGIYATMQFLYQS